MVIKSNISPAIKITILTFLFLALVFNLLNGQKTITDSSIVSPFGKVYIHRQSDRPRNLVILISGDAGWKYQASELSGIFSGMNAIIAEVNILRYYGELNARSSRCSLVSPDFVELATAVEKKYNFEGYIPPVLMGYSGGAALVYGILAQARPGTFTGGISLGFCPVIENPKMLCQLNGLTCEVKIEGKSYYLMPDSHLGNPWIVLQGKKDTICGERSVTEFVKKTAGAELVEVPLTGHNFSRLADFKTQWRDSYARLLSRYLASQPVKTEISRLSHIPYNLTREKTKLSNSPVVLFFSGDGGWYGFEQTIADKLAVLGVPTIGIDTKRYLWNKKTPEEAANDMADLLNYYGKEWGKTKFTLIGYSQGAEMIPFIVNRLPDNIKSNIVLAVMLSPETMTDFEIHISNMLGLGSRQNKLDVINEIKKMKDTPSLCIFGENEKNPVPRLLQDSPVKIALIPGDHHYKSNESLIVKTMKDKNAF